MIVWLFFVGLVSHASCQEWQSFGNNQYYYASKTANNYDDANSTCAKDGATLAIIKSEEENNFISQDLTENQAENLVIGLRKIKPGTDEFEWIDGSPLEYKNWADGRPNYSGDCVVMVGAVWNDYNCLREMQYVCQRFTGSTTSTTATTTTTTPTTSTTATKKQATGSTTAHSNVLSQTTATTVAEEFSTYGIEQYKTLLIIVTSVSGGVILILVIVIIVLMRVKASTKSSEEDDLNSMQKGLDSPPASTARSNMSYMWNSISTEDKNHTREIPRPSVLGANSTMSYYNNAFKRGPYNDIEMETFPEEVIDYNSPEETGYGGYNHTYSKLSRLR